MASLSENGSIFLFPDSLRNIWDNEGWYIKIRRKVLLEKAILAGVFTEYADIRVQQLRQLSFYGVTYFLSF